MLIGAITILVALYVAWSIGSNDVNFASPVASRTIKVKHAVILAALAAFIGAMFFGGGVSETLREKVLFDTITIQQVFAVMLGCAAWCTIASYKGWPISSTVSLLGAMMGVALVTGNGINTATVMNIGLAWIISPVAGFLVAFASYKVFANILFHNIRSFGTREKLEVFMSYVQLVVVVGSVIARSANDVAQAIFFFEAQNPLLFHALGGFGMALGLLTLGRKVIKSLGTRLIQLSPSSGVAVQLSSMLVVSFFTTVGMPISSSVVFVAALAGAGKARRENVNMKFVKEILFSWAVTLPISAMMAVLIYSVTSIF